MFYFKQNNQPTNNNHQKVKGKQINWKEKIWTNKEKTNKCYHLGLCATREHSGLDLPPNPNADLDLALTAPTVL